MDVGDHSLVVSLWFAVARARDTDETLHAHLRAALGVAAAVDEQLVRAGLAGVAGALEAQQRIDAVLGGIDGGRLEALRETVAALERELRQAAQLLARLRALKETLARPT